MASFITLRKEATSIHVTIADAVIEKMKESGRDIRVARDYLLKPSDLENVDLVVSLGGDGTFLKTASFIN
jgi:NAD kinase